MVTEREFLVKEFRRLQQSTSADNLPVVLAEYVGQWYYPRLPKSPDEEEEIKERPFVSPERISDIVLQYYNMPWETVSRRSRKREIVMVRSRLMYFLRTRGRMTCTSVADLFNLDHTTVIHAWKNVRDEMETDRTLRKEMEYINSLI